MNRVIKWNFDGFSNFRITFVTNVIQVYTVYVVTNTQNLI
jgi:hypothetical protein